MTETNGIRFDREGGFTAGSMRIPAEQPNNVVVGWKDLARLAEAWGTVFAETDDNRARVIKALEGQAYFTNIDRGNLQRIACATEKLASYAEKIILPLRDVITLARIAIEPHATQARNELSKWHKEQRAKAERLIAEQEIKHGPCPEKVGDAIITDLLHYVFKVTTRYEIFSESLHDQTRYDRVGNRIRPVGRRGSKLRKAYDVWMRKRIKRPITETQLVAQASSPCSQQ